MTCRTCEEDFVAYPGKPGFVNECERCTQEKARANPVLKIELKERDKDNWSQIRRIGFSPVRNHGYHRKFKGEGK